MADFPAIGPEFLVNSVVAGDQLDAQVARDAAGNIIVAWESDGEDGDETGIYAQRFNRDGVPVGGAFQVNTFTNGNQSDPVVAMDVAGNVVIAWVDQGRPSLIDGGLAPLQMNEVYTSDDLIALVLHSVWRYWQTGTELYFQLDHRTFLKFLVVQLSP